MNRYSFSDGFGNNSFTSMAFFHLIIINAIIFFAQSTFSHSNILGLGSIESIFALHYFDSSSFKPFQLITYAFLHADFMHIFCNMFGLFMFGSAFERALGKKKFLIFYFITAIGAGFIQEIAWRVDMNSFLAQFDDLTKFANGTRTDDGIFLSSIDQVLEWKDKALCRPTTVGASGAIFGLTFAFGYLFPNTNIYIYGILPVKAKIFVIFYIALELFFGVANFNYDNVAHFAHLGGILFGFILLLYWKNRNELY